VRAQPAAFGVGLAADLGARLAAVVFGAVAFGAAVFGAAAFGAGDLAGAGLG